MTILESPQIPTLSEPDLTKIECTYRIVTPMFLGDADTKCADNISPQAFKGALRFWWRALNWSKHQDLSKLHAEECRLFGGDSEHRGQGVVLLSVNQTEPLNTQGKASQLRDLSYVTIGINGSMRSDDRHFIKQNSTFDVCVTLKPNAKTEDKESITDAIKAIGLFGGLGAKSRKGFGSLSLVSLDRSSMTTQTDESFKERGSQLISKYPIATVTEYPPFTAFSQHSLWLDMAESHADLIAKYKQFLTSNQGSGNGKLEFGEPKVGHSKNPNNDRRSSPLFMHIQPLGGIAQCASILFLPAIWTPTKPTGDKNYALVREYLSKNKQDAFWGTSK